MTPCERSARVLDDALAAGVFCAVTAEVGRLSGAIWQHAAGRLGHQPDASAVTLDTVFDLASLTKVLATTTATLRLVGQGSVSLDASIGDQYPAWRSGDRAIVAVRHLLEHSSGLPAYRPYYQQLAGEPAYLDAIAREPLDYTPATRSVYSDLGFILLGCLVAHAGGERLDQQFDRWKGAAGIDHPLQFLPPAAWGSSIAPTEHDPWRGRLLTGEVHDENAAALGGIAGHAGLFGTARAVGQAARWWLSVLSDDVEPTGVNRDLARHFTRRSAVPGSSRALGWDTMLSSSSCGAHWSPSAIGHTGFTGTSLWIDVERDLYAVLLTNRVYPTRADDRIQQVRREFHTAVVADLGYL
ncbi:MAG: serine hydrolase domain-containing protein [Acidobacteriota bacterium]